MIRHFTATAVVHRENGDVLLLFHRKLNCWLPPGGHAEQDELPHEAALREIREETGLEAQLLSAPSGWVVQDEHTAALPNPLCILAENIPDRKIGLHVHIDLVYRAQVSGEPVLNAQEAREVRFFTPEEVKKLELYPNVRSVIEESLRLWRQEHA